MSPSQPDHYNILGVAKDAQIPEIRSVYKKLVLKCHPDKFQDAALKAEKQDEFQKVQTAYEVLSNEKDRRRYDESLRLAELKAQMLNKANSSAPRTTKYDVNIPETSRSSYKSSSGSPRGYGPYSPSYDEDRRSRSRSRHRYYESEPRHSSKREATYSERPSKRDSEKEREKDKDQKERERRKREKKEREREREEEQRRQEKAAAKKEKKEREKQKSKDIKKGSEEKRRENMDEIYVEISDEYPKLEKKKSSSKKHDEKRERERERERSLHRDEPPRVPEAPSRAKSYAQEYIRMARSTDPVYFSDKPAAPSPPPLRNGPHQPPPPEDEARRSSAHSRRGSPEDYQERSHRKSSREHLDSHEHPIMTSSSPPKYASSPPKYASSPPNLSRTNSVPVGTAPRPIPPGRSNTYNSYGDGGESPGANRGRHKSRHYAQVPEESEDEEDYERRHRSSKHRSSKKHRSPDRQTTKVYHIKGDGRTTLYPSTSYTYTSRGDFEPASYSSSYYDYADQAQRPPMYARDSGYSGSSGSHYNKVKTSRTYGPEDFTYSSYNNPSFGDDYSAVGA